MWRLSGWAATMAVALSASIAAENVVAQDSLSPPASRAPAGAAIALVDIGYIFNHCARFKALMEELKRDIERFTADARAERNAIAQLGERLQQYRSGTPDYQALDAEIAKRQAEFTAKYQLRSREFARREARIGHDVYGEIRDVTDDYMRRHNIDVVLRFNGNPVEPEQLDSVREFITRPVVSYRRDLDITPAILEYLNRSSPEQAAPAQPSKEPYR
jgi:Skp family chaperone for outer membrane proteins